MCAISGLRAWCCGWQDLPDGRASTIRNVRGSVSSFGSDGPSVMTGCREGVATCLKRLNSNIISFDSCPSTPKHTLSPDI